MAMQLVKDETYNLYQTDANGAPTGRGGLSVVKLGLRWEPVKAERKGLGGWAERKLREAENKTNPEDWDAGAIFLTGGDPKKYIGFGDLMPFKDEATQQARNSAQHSGDSRRGDGDGDDELVTLQLLDIPQRYDQILFVAGAYKLGAEVDAVRDVKATLYDGSDNSVIAEYEPSLLGTKRMIAICCFTRVAGQNGLFDLHVVNESFDCAAGDFRSLLRNAMQVALPPRSA